MFSFCVLESYLSEIRKISNSFILFTHNINAIQTISLNRCITRKKKIGIVLIMKYKILEIITNIINNRLISKLCY